MAYSGKVLARAREELAQLRADNEREHSRRLAQVTRQIPRLGQIDRRMRALMPETALTALGQGTRTPEKIAREGVALAEEEARLLTENGYAADYLRALSTCPLCRDSGYVRGSMCSCLRQRCSALAVAELERSMHRQGESFAEFDLDYYSPEPAGRSPREYMAVVLTVCRNWAENFARMDYSLLLRGGTGLGKTFLSGCIGRTVAAAGCTVTYVTAVEALEAFETRKFSRDEDAAQAAQTRTEQYLGCDLLILDDLGTEMTTSFSQSALYTILNTRLIGGKKTVVSTNLTSAELHSRYSPQICSRLEGEFHILEFYGRDIRAIKKERSWQ